MANEPSACCRGALQAEGLEEEQGNGRASKASVAGMAMKRWEGELAGQEVEGGRREGQIMQGFPDHLRTWVSP